MAPEETPAPSPETRPPAGEAGGAPPQRAPTGTDSRVVLREPREELSPVLNLRTAELPALALLRLRLRERYLLTTSTMAP